MKPIIEIKYRNLPREIISDFETSIDKSVSLSIYHDENDHFDASADIVIYINEHLTEILVSGVTGLLSSGIKYAISTSFKKLIAYISKQKKKEHKEGKNRIELSFKIKPDKTIEFNLESNNVDLKTIDDINDKIFNYLKDKDQQENHFSNLSFKDNDSPKPKIKMKWNPKIKKWQPENFAEIIKQNEELIRRFNQKMDS